MTTQIRRSVFFFVLAMVVLAHAAVAQVTVILVRHAEKAAEPAENPGLTEAGRQRAELLADMLADSGVEAIYVTDLLRTQMTAAPLAERTHLKPIVLPARDIGDLVKDIRTREKGVVVVVGHSNTVPAIITALGGPKLEIPDAQYDNLLVLTVEPTRSSLLRLHFGSGAPAPSQTGTMQK